MDNRLEMFSRNSAILQIGENRYIYRRDREAEENENGKKHFRFFSSN